MQKERIQKVLARAGYASRRKIEEAIRKGSVALNGVVITKLGTTMDPLVDLVTVDGKLIQLISQKKYFLFYKPLRVLSSCFDQKKRKTVLDFFSRESERLFPVGRLDYMTEGLIIITNDGDLTYALTHPKHEISKQYLIQIKEKISDEELDILRNGIVLDGYRTKPCQVMLKENTPSGSWIDMSLFEGRNRQIRKMMESIHKHVLSLTRTRIGPCTIGSLKPGQYRVLTKKEMEYFLDSQEKIQKEIV